MHITAPPLVRDAMCAGITRILNAHGLSRVVLAGHSYGTVISAYLLRRQWASVDPQLNPLATQTPRHTQYPVQESTNRHHVIVTLDDRSGGDLIAAVLLMDPVPFLLHYPAISYNFVYRQPRHANEWGLWYFSSRDADTARALLRHFFWHECILFREDVLGATGGGGYTEEAEAAAGEQGRKMQQRRRPMPVTVSLAGRDQIVDARAVRAYLTGSKDPEDEEQGNAGEEGARRPPSRWAQNGLEVLYFPELDHAMVFDTPRDRAPILGALRRFVRQEEEEEEEEESENETGAGAPMPPLVDVE